MKKSYYRLTGRFAHQDVVLREFFNCSDAQEAVKWSRSYLGNEANTKEHMRLYGVLVDAILTYHVEETAEVKRFTL